MPRYIAFLRSINVGGRNVKMTELRRLFEAMGFACVETFIASGNVIFESPARNAKSLETKIAGQLHKALGYEIAVFVRSADELTGIAKHKLFGKRPEGAGLVHRVSFRTARRCGKNKTEVASDQGRHFLF